MYLDEAKQKPPRSALEKLFQLIQHPVALWFVVGVGIWMFIIPSPKDFVAVQNYLLLMMLSLIPVLGFRYLQNRGQKLSWFRRFSWVVFPIFVPLYINIFSDGYFDNRISINGMISTTMLVIWFAFMLIPTLAWMVINTSLQARHPDISESGCAQNGLYLLTILVGMAVVLSTETAEDWRPVFMGGLVCVAILLIIDFLLSLGFGRASISEHWRRISPQWRLNIIVIVAILLLLFATVVVMTYPSIDSLTRLTLGSLLSVGFLLLAYQGFLYLKIWLEQRQQDQESMQLARDTDIPEHYTIGDDGQIVEVKKPKAKRSKKPHQR